MTNPSEIPLPTTPTTPTTPSPTPSPIDDELDRTYHAITQLIQTTLNSPPPITPRLSIEFQPDHLQLCLTPNHEQQHHSIIISIDHTTTSSSPSSPSPSPSSSPSSSSPSTQQHHQHQQNQQQQQLCLTPTSHTSFDFKTIRPNRTMSLSSHYTTQSNLTHSHLRHRSNRPPLLTIQPNLHTLTNNPNTISSAPANSSIIINPNNNKITKTNNNHSKTQSSSTSHFTRSLLPSKSSIGRTSKFSLATVNTNGLILVPSNGSRRIAAPITNLSMMPLYLVQPFLSPNPSTATTLPSQPNTPFNRLSIHHHQPPPPLAFARLFPERSSFPISPILPSPHHHKHHHRSSNLINCIHKLLLFLTHPPLHLLRSIKTPTKITGFRNTQGFPSSLSGEKEIEEKKKKKKKKKKEEEVGILLLLFRRLMDTFNRRREDRTKLLTQAEKTVVLSDHYCCFAIPLYNTGIYSILAQFTIFGFVFGILSFSAPSILAIVLDFSFTAFFGVLCLAVGSIQALGFYGVYKEKPIIFKRYFMGNVGLIGITFLYSMILLIISSTKHQTAIDQCLLQFVSNDEFVDGPSNSSRQLCSVWTWAQLAVCFFVWFLFFFSQLYFCYMVKVWGQDQRLDHIRYQSLISAVRQSRATSSMVQPSHLEGGDEWESRSTGGSLDIRSSTYSGHSNRRAKGGVANGGSRLKNEIEWKEIPHSNDEPVSPPPAHQQVSSDSSESSESARRKQKYRQRTARLDDDEDEDPIDPHLVRSPPPASSGSSTLITHSNHHRRQLSSSAGHPSFVDRDPRVDGHWIEVIDQSLPDPALASHPQLPPNHQKASLDDREYYKS
ncbi:hypothetical protein PGTUg99_033035 [Puccinia graminis f. sp. tritici]|uniref:Uncharacterized protein n=1 Tax=Puccinia graminis f. sp. tritici TaxID=56615 RepID=A0A5B0SM82_PUCGR|nr:hypothetical protein PGTUg99_033035 [Puccinia graminis f. sp. tritici]